MAEVAACNVDDSGGGLTLALIPFCDVSDRLGVVDGVVCVEDVVFDDCCCDVFCDCVFIGDVIFDDGRGCCRDCCDVFVFIEDDVDRCCDCICCCCDVFVFIGDVVFDDGCGRDCCVAKRRAA